MTARFVLDTSVKGVLVIAFVMVGGVFSSLNSAEISPAVASPSYALIDGMNEFGLWAGVSPDSAEFIGKAEDRSLVLLGFRYGRILSAWSWGSLEYTLDILPAAVVFEPERVRRGSSTIYGAGLSPLGLKVKFWTRKLDKTLCRRKCRLPLLSG